MSCTFSVSNGRRIYRHMGTYIMWLWNQIETKQHEDQLLLPLGHAWLPWSTNEEEVTKRYLGLATLYAARFSQSPKLPKYPYHSHRQVEWKICEPWVQHSLGSNGPRCIASMWLNHICQGAGKSTDWNNSKDNANLYSQWCILTL